VALPLIRRGTKSCDGRRVIARRRREQPVLTGVWVDPKIPMRGFATPRLCRVRTQANPASSINSGVRRESA